MILLELNRRVSWDGAPFRGGRTIPCGPFVRESATFTRRVNKEKSRQLISLTAKALSLVCRRVSSID